jgi:hypothetical protein
MVHGFRIVIVISLLLLLALPVAAQTSDVVVPDVRGLSLPVAVAALNRAGLALGVETSLEWASESGLPPNTISEQGAEPGATVAAGSAIDVTVLRSANVLLIYDDNDITLVNLTGAALDLGSIVFRGVDGTNPSFAAGRWRGSLNAGDCAQLWSIRASAAKDIPECTESMFWMGTGGNSVFSVIQGNIERGVCPVSTAGRCEVYVPGGATGDPSTPFVYLVYTLNELAIINPTPDAWMMMSGYEVVNNVTGQALRIPVSDPTLYGGNVNPVARVGQLAPGQCILFTNGDSQAAPPDPCDVIARLAIAPELRFWQVDFGMNSVSGDIHTCPAALLDQTTVCIMPR